MNKSIALVALLTLGSATLPSRAEISVDFFYDSLAPHGDWIDVADYGYAWHPRDVGRDWRPYSDGRWAYTDAGWTWVSDEPHGWATYHYGRWANVESVGWVWVPGTEWGPAWVSWRRSDRHVGWAPLPPESTFRASVSIGNWADSYYDIGPANYTFVEVRHLGAPRLRTVILPARENIVFVRETRNITNIFVRNEIVINEGPRYEEISRISAEPIQRLRLDRRQDVRADVASMRTRVEGDSLSIAAPTVNFNREAAPKRVTRKVADARVNRGWTGVNAAPQEVERLRASVKQEAAPPADLPAKPTFDREQRATTATGGKTEAPAATTSRPGERATSEKKEAPTATVPSSPDTPDNRATTPDSTTPAKDARRPGSRGGLREETTGKPDSTAPAEATTPAERQGRGKGRTPRESSTTPATTTPEPTDTKVKPEATRSETEGRPGRAVRPAGEDARGRREAETGKPESPGASTTPGSPDPAATGRPETPGRSTPAKRPEAPGRSEAPGRETPKAEAEKPRSESSRSEASGNSRSKRSEAPAERPEPKATPTPQERPQAKPERSSRAPEREERSAAAAGAERAKAARSAATERIQPKVERSEARAERPQPKTERLPAVAERPEQQKGQPKAEASSGGSGEEKSRGKKKEQ